MTEHPILFSGAMVRAILGGTKTQTRRLLKGSTEFRGPYNPAYLEVHRRAEGWAKICPHGVPGDRLWVRETWAEIGPGFIYAATDAEHNIGQRWRPSIHMPRRASRLSLEVVSVRVERLQEINEEDAKAEGLEWVAPTWGIPEIPASWMDSPRESIVALWDSINGGRAPWKSNPWVWRVEFKREVKP